MAIWLRFIPKEKTTLFLRLPEVSLRGLVSLTLIRRKKLHSGLIHRRYDWDGADVGTFVCKKEAKVPIDLIDNWTLDEVWTKSWDLEIAEEDDVVPVDFNTDVVPTPAIPPVSMLDPLPSKKDAKKDSALGIWGLFKTLTSLG
eukprot:GEMP01040139.1.p2 GENE.GEMP01040139.1~~GEMP01040139.1.p2  ORF type:complete len:143 (+),score=27.45 GEMP01040139.1:358-786(+)